MNLQHRCHRNGGGCTRSASSFETTSVELTRGTRVKQVLPAFSYLVFPSQWSVPTAATAMASLAACINRLLMQHGYAFSFNFECLVLNTPQLCPQFKPEARNKGVRKGRLVPMIVGRLLQKLLFRESPSSANRADLGRDPLALAGRLHASSFKRLANHLL